MTFAFSFFPSTSTGPFCGMERSLSRSLSLSVFFGFTILVCRLGRKAGNSTDRHSNPRPRALELMGKYSPTLLVCSLAKRPSMRNDSSWSLQTHTGQDASTQSGYDLAGRSLAIRFGCEEKGKSGRPVLDARAGVYHTIS